MNLIIKIEIRCCAFPYVTMRSQFRRFLPCAFQSVASLQKKAFANCRKIRKSDRGVLLFFMNTKLRQGTTTVYANSKAIIMNFTDHMSHSK